MLGLSVRTNSLDYFFFFSRPTFFYNSYNLAMATAKKRTRISESTDSPSDETRANKRPTKASNSLLDSLLPTTKALTKKVTDEDFRIVAGCYERILYGIDAYWMDSEGEGVCIISPEIHLPGTFRTKFLLFFSLKFLNPKLA